MIRSDWENLAHLSTIVCTGNPTHPDPTPMARHNYAALLDETMAEDEHPEWYEGPCLCNACRSCAEG